MSSEESSKRSKRRRSVSPDTVNIAFVTCPRCSYFLTGYRLIHSDLDEAIKTSQDGWLSLSWNGPTRNLVHKVYGGRIDQDVSQFSGVCRECHRAYVYDGGESENDKPSFRIKVYPG